MTDPAPQLAADPTPADLVTAFLAAMEARELERAQALLAPGFRMVFPGTGPMHSLSELTAWASGRYQRVAKDILRVETLSDGPKSTIFVSGTLYGAWSDGTPFQGIRFIDRFEVESGLITAQDVWNDIAEVRPR